MSTANYLSHKMEYENKQTQKGTLPYVAYVLKSENIKKIQV